MMKTNDIINRNYINYIQLINKGNEMSNVKNYPSDVPTNTMRNARLIIWHWNWTINAQPQRALETSQRHVPSISSPA